MHGQLPLRLLLSVPRSGPAARTIPPSLRSVRRSLQAQNRATARVAGKSTLIRRDARLTYIADLWAPAVPQDAMRMIESPNAPELSVVIPAYNEEANLGIVVEDCVARLNATSLRD